MPEPSPPSKAMNRPARLGRRCAPVEVRRSRAPGRSARRGWRPAGPRAAARPCGRPSAGRRRPRPGTPPRGQQQHHVLPGRGVDDVADLHVAGAGQRCDQLGEAVGQERHHRDDSEQDDLDGGRKKAKTRPRVWSSTSRPTMVKPVAYAMPPSAPSRITNRTTATSTGTRPMRRAAPRRHDGQAEQPAAAEVAEQARAEEHAERDADEDGREDQAPARVAAVQGLGDVGVAEPDDHPGRDERADHADDQAAHDRGARR